MINVVIPISQKADKFYEILGKLASLNDVNVQVGVCQSDAFALKNIVGDAENISVHVYIDGTEREEMINAMQPYLVTGSTMVMRKPITLDEFNKFILQKKDVVTCEKKLSKFKAFMMSMWQKILKLFLGVKLYEGDTSVVYFNEDISAVVSQSANLSYSSRANRWRGIEQSTVETKSENVKTPSNKKSNLILIISAVIAIAVAGVVTTVVCVFAKLSIIIGLLLACLDIIAIAVAIIMCVMLAFNSIVGRRDFGRAIEIIEE